MSADQGFKDQGVQLAVMDGLEKKGIQEKMVTWYALTVWLFICLASNSSRYRLTVFLGL